MNLEIIKEIKLTVHGVQKVGDVLKDLPDNQCDILIRKGFGKEVKKLTDDQELEILIKEEEKDTSSNSEPVKRKRRTKAEIEADKNVKK